MSRALVSAVGRTDAGCVRENNEDSFAIDSELGLLVVADGMGGHNSGEIASRLATETILDFGRKVLGGAVTGAPGSSAGAGSFRVRQMEYIVQMANTVIFEKAQSSAQNRGMGTTIVAALVHGGTVAVAHVGDSRLYVFRKGELQLLTEDHSLVMEQLRRGLLNPEEAQRSELQNVLIRALGTESRVVVDIQEHPLLAQDVLLLCTDGLTKMVADERIARALSETPELPAACDRLVDMAREAGGADNVTVIAGRPVASKRGLQGWFSRFFSVES
ncbi:MAG: Stp1/IreP family PP2C-type Ser/Thr phosphatase [Elusimicrobia bacterium]|nr:Stp1/IreP family PP2C-type Ser/Thr phosphatase [Elusimicrobiota bacterium]